jgi:hypothetical protein
MVMTNPLDNPLHGPPLLENALAVVDGPPRSNTASTVQLMDNPPNGVLENEFYHCSAEWHLARLRQVCALIYPVMLRVSSAESGPRIGSIANRFFGSANSLASYLGYSESQILIGFKELQELGFIELQDSRKFAPNVYRVLRHDEWAQRHPGQCTSKVKYPWTGEGDLFGGSLWIASGSRVKFQPNQIRGLRNLGFSDGVILAHFENFWTQHSDTRSVRNIPQRFYAYLTNL